MYMFMDILWKAAITVILLHLIVRQNKQAATIRLLAGASRKLFLSISAGKQAQRKAICKAGETLEDPKHKQGELDNGGALETHADDQDSRPGG